MRHTQHLFSYGTLQDEDVQKSLINRKLKGKRDILLGYRISRKKFKGQYPIMEVSNDRLDEVAGKVFRVSYVELYEIDSYETKMYKRVEVVLKSGTKAWAYIENLG